ncbi:neutral amino acid transporter [Cryptococcus neoformans var. grubii Br795]|uniref:Neutral amino acid transporter n=1 Tax=Cryptococcus neoformans Tu259-1 TaxID=1230072 RepID=A0A854QEY4_CRYNE|nr:neutral amino acid transporter [Cryptococcus neoformans var. grubii AD1-83a]OWZ57610.1 neutral amino acid transporter [Cryptococcus neoformans var. grubii 125.91]OXG21959.1 neutral amino acid transporter [Cryptococcus neoformans var. grubii Tu259-1]OXG50257.1 neutral amino acid transporter [Cryptococcus neoformans var. grubii Th84]OXG60477.1 neutral amino acid transporter [Cryptococcus neoformans var. grubii MW-RSA1955]OXG64276.1 neutral amino acid transporter [Cryptococcus neoformans var. 
MSQDPYTTKTSEINMDDNMSTNKNVSLSRVVTALEPEQVQVVDGVWGTLDESAPNYRSLGWIRASVLMIKVQIGLGVLAIPAVLDTFGLIPAILIIFAVAAATTWADYVVGVFKQNHPEVYTLADVGYIMWGPIGREVFGAIYWIQLTAVAGAGLLSVSVALNAMSGHATCTIVFVVVAAIINILVSSIQTLDRISWIGWIGLGGIMSSVITLAIAVSVQDRPSAAPATGDWSPDIVLVGNPAFPAAVGALSNIIFSFAGAPNFFNIVAEMKNPRDFNKALISCQTFVTAAYLIIGCVVYHYCGQYIASPALGSAGILMKKVCYGLALPGLVVGCVLNTHLPAKYIFVRLMRNSKHLSANTIQHRVIWVSCVVLNCTISFVIAEGIPIFNDLIGLIGALFATPNAIIFECMMYIWDVHYCADKYPSQRTWKQRSVQVFNVIVLLLSIFAMVAGTYAAAVTIRDDVASNATSKPFSCDDNSG